MSKVDKTQKTILNLIFNSLQFVPWIYNGKDAGFVLRNEFEKCYYPLNPELWNEFLPPGFYFGAPAPSPEFKLQSMLDRHFDEISKLIVKNDWLQPSMTVTSKKSKLLFFSVNAINDLYIKCPYKLGDNSMISCKQLLELKKSEILAKMQYKIAEGIHHRIGRSALRKLKNCPAHKRTRMYLQLTRDLAG